MTNSRLRILITTGAALVMLSGLAAAQVFPVDTILSNGPTDKRINLVFLAEGYTAAEMGKFHSDALSALAGLVNTSPYKEYANLFNAYEVQVVSNESGTDHPRSAPDCPASIPAFSADTYFNSTFDAGSIHRALVATRSIVLSVLNTNFPEWDAAFVIVNTSVYGGTGGVYATFSTHTAAPEIAIHELGHAYAKLADEYDYGSQAGREAPNTTAETNRDLIKWNIWIEPTTPIPTPETDTYAAVIGLFEGAVYNTTGWYRPKLNCKMQSLGIPFCAVCAEQTIITNYKRLSPIDAIDPDVPMVSIPWGNTSVLSVTPLVVVPNTMVSTWYVDGTMAANSTSLQISAESYDTGYHEVEVVVHDATSMVRNDPLGLLRDSTGWTIYVQPPPYKIGDANSDGVVTSADAIFLVNHIFKSGPPPSPWVEAGDMDCSGALSSGDIIMLIAYLFRGGATPPLVCP